MRQEPSLDRTKLKQIAKTLTRGGTTVLVSAVYEMYDRFLRNAGDRWPVLVIVTSDGTEGSGQFYPEKFAAFGRDMQAKDVVAHAIVLISAKGDALQVQIARALTGGTGGTYNTTATGGDLTSQARGDGAGHRRRLRSHVLAIPPGVRDRNRRSRPPI